MKRWSRLGVVFGITVLSFASAGAAVASGMPVKAEPFGLQEVRLLDGPFRDAMLRDRAYLLSLDPNRLLHTFRLNVGLPSSSRPYGGWEAPDCEVRGHSLGHYLSACALMYASTGEEEFKTRADSIVAELGKCQAASPQAGYNPGYLSAYPESFIDRVEARKPVWAPWYTLHKIMAGLLEVHQLCGNPQALEILVKQAAWVKLRIDRLTPEQIQAMLETEFGGMNEVLANLYAVTGNPDHLRLAEAFEHRIVFDPLARGEDKLDGLHANTQIPKMIGVAREYELTGKDQYLNIATFFWERVALHRSYVVGGHSDHEHFFPIDQFTEHLSTETCETCNTYNMLKLTRHLFGWAPSARTMDFYERALYNHILASQDPETGMFVYFLSLKPGHFKAYSTPTDSFWCCVGTGMENHAKYGDTIYFHDGDSLFVNLFVPSEVRWKERGLVVRQETKFPEQDSTRLIMKCARPVKCSVQIRYPSWASSMAVTVNNGKQQGLGGTPGSYVSLTRDWMDGDRVEVRLGMALRTEALPGAPDTVALCYGPMVLAGELGRKDLPDLYLSNQTALSKLPTSEVPDLIGEPKDLLRHFHAVPTRPLGFRAMGLGRLDEVIFVPIYQVHHQRYSVYWKVAPKMAASR